MLHHFGLALMSLLIAACAPAFSADAADVPEDKPTNSGILHLGGLWHWSSGQHEPSSEGVVHLDRLPRVRLRDMKQDDRMIWRRFRLPKTWAGRRVLLVYDVVGWEVSGIAGIWVNGKYVDVTLPKRGRGLGTFPQSGTDADASEVRWFREITSELDPGKENVVRVRVRRWPMQPNQGVWLLAPPSKEKVLFLLSDGLTATERRLATRYVRSVSEHYAVKAVQRSGTFSNPEALRGALLDAYTKDDISGAVLIGQFPLATEEIGEAKAITSYFEAFSLPQEAVKTFGNGYRKLDIWTAWIRKVPGHEETLADYLRKTNRYYTRRLPFPDRGLVQPDPRGHPYGGDQPVTNGVDHWDLLSRPADLTYFNAHGGTSHGGVGPHNTVAVQESLGVYPGGLIIRLYGCSAGNIARHDMTPGESFLFGRAVTQTVITHTRPEGGAFLSVPWYMFGDLMTVCPNLGTAYQLLYEFRGKYPYSLVLLGNPFVKVGHQFADPSGSVCGKVTAMGSDIPHVYVSAHIGDKSFGRVKVKPDATYELDCLPPATYDVSLHVNALESLKRRVRVGDQTVATENWELPRLWRVDGRLLGSKGEPVADSWVEIATKPTNEDFRSNDLHPVSVDVEGRFSIFGIKDQTFWVRGCVGKRGASPPVRVTVGKGSVASAVDLTLPQ